MKDKCYIFCSKETFKRGAFTWLDTWFHNHWFSTTEAGRLGWNTCGHVHGVWNMRFISIKCIVQCTSISICMYGQRLIYITDRPLHLLSPWAVYLGWVQTSKCFVSCLHPQTVPSLNDEHSHIPAISSSTHPLGDIGYFCIMKIHPMALPSLFAIVHAPDLSFVSIQQTFTANSRSLEQTFAGLNTALLHHAHQCQYPTDTTPQYWD